MLSERKQTVLKNIINAYLQTMQPVGSKGLAADGSLDVSAATIRNEMNELEKMGFITHPHTSAGRIPTDKGYRYFVDNLLGEDELPSEVAKAIESEYRRKIRSLDDLIDKTSRIVSTLTQQICVAALVKPERLILKQVQLVLLDTTRVLVIWISTMGTVKHSIVDMKETMDVAYLQRIANYLNSELAGEPLENVVPVLTQRLRQERDSLHHVLRGAQRLVKASMIHQSENDFTLALEGRNFIFDKPDFEDASTAKGIFEIFDNREKLFSLLPVNSSDRSVVVRIGRECGADVLSECMLMSSNLYIDTEPVGMITILGPKRSSYGYGISLLGYISEIVNDQIKEIYTF